MQKETKKPFRKPTLRIYGHISTITKTGIGTTRDSGSGRRPVKTGV